MSSLETRNKLAEDIIEAGVYNMYWDRPKSEWPVSEQGRICPAYCNIRSLVGNVSMRQMIGMRLVETLETNQVTSGKEIDVINGIVSAGVPWATIACEKLGLPMCYTRPNIKAYGEKTSVEGMLEQGMVCEIIDDVFLTGSTITKTSLQLSAEGVTVAGITVLLRLSDETGKIHLPDGSFTSVDVTSLCDYSDLVTASVRMGLMDNQQAEKLTSYYQNPETQPWN